MRERGVSEEEVWQTIDHGKVAVAREQRLGREMVFTDGYVRKKIFYPHKQVSVIFVRENDDIVIVTIFAFYGRWEV